MGAFDLKGERQSEYDVGMSTIADIEAAIAQLSPKEVEELARWLEAFRRGSQSPSQNREAAVDLWLKTATGVAKPGVTTERVMALSRGEE